MQSSACAWLVREDPAPLGLFLSATALEVSGICDSKIMTHNIVALKT